MKKFRKLLPALSMLLISALLMGSSTFAWFSMNTTVTATGMHVKAKAEDGIVISNVDKNAWNEPKNPYYDFYKDYLLKINEKIFIQFFA